MRHQKTYENYNNNIFKSSKDIISKKIPKKIDKEVQKPFRKRTLSFSKFDNKFKCKEHNRNFYKYCILCKNDICPQCYNNNHFIHDALNYGDIALNENQMKLFKKEYNEYMATYSQILIKIKEWQNSFNNAILEFEKYMRNNIIEVIKNMINNYDINNINYNTIIEYRIIFSLILENNKENISNQKMIKLMKSYISLKNYDIYQYIDQNENLSSISKEVLSLLNNILDKGNFLQKGNNIIKFIFNNFPLFSNQNKNDSNEIDKLGVKYIKNNDKKENIFIDNKSINNKSTNNILDSSKNFKKILYNNNTDNNIYEKKKPFDKNKNGEIFLEKEELPIFNYDTLTQPKEDVLDINLLKNSKNSSQKKSSHLYLRKTSMNNPSKGSIVPKKEEKHNYLSSKDKNPLWKTSNYFHTRNTHILNGNEELNDLEHIKINLNYKNENNRNCSLNKRPIIFNNNINNFNNINNINSKNNIINNYNINKIYSERNKKSKVYIHKKFNTTLMGAKNVNILNKSQLDKNNEGDFNIIDLNNNDTYISSNTISNTDKKNPNSYKEKDNHTSSKRLAFENEKINNIWKIKKVKEFSIDINKDINIGFELGISECKIGIINQDSNCVELWAPYEHDNNKIGVPSLISFKDKNDNIIIGEDAKESKINNPSYTFFNFIKFIGKNYKEIYGKKELWSYKIYNNIKTGKPYVKGVNNQFKNKVYNFEDLLSLYLRKLFKLLFNKINIKNDKKNNLIKINIIVTVPNNYNYFQRKIIEKIFLTQLFSKKNLNIDIPINYSENNKIINNKTQLYAFGKYNIQIKNIKIENSSNIGYLYLFQNQIENNLNNSNKKIILIHIDGGSINISLISALINNAKNKNNEECANKYEIKGIKGTVFGEQDFTDNLVNSCLCDFTEKIRDECLKTPSALAKLRKSCEEAEKYFYKKNQTEINIQKLYDNVDLKMTLNKNDYEHACNDQFQIINEIIKDLIIKSNICEKEIDDIIFIGNTTNVYIIKQKISKIFKNKNNVLFNKLINNTYFENNLNNIDYINEDFIAIGTCLQSYNLYTNKNNKFKYIERTPISFGIEGLDKKMDFVIEKGNIIPIKVNKFVKIVKPQGDKISINIYEGDDKYVNNNRLISSANLSITNFKNEKKGKDYIEILIQFIINTNFDLNVFILDTKTLRRKFECIINIDIVQG